MKKRLSYICLLLSVSSFQAFAGGVDGDRSSLPPPTQATASHVRASSAMGGYTGLDEEVDGLTWVDTFSELIRNRLGPNSRRSRSVSDPSASTHTQKIHALKAPQSAVSEAKGANPTVGPEVPSGDGS